MREREWAREGGCTLAIESQIGKLGEREMIHLHSGSISPGTKKEQERKEGVNSADYLVLVIVSHRPNGGGKHTKKGGERATRLFLDKVLCGTRN